MQEISKRTICLGTLGLVVSLSLGACAPDSTTAEPISSPAETTTSAFPTTLVHVGGQTTLEQLPERVVTIGTQQTNSTVALGVLPVGASKSYSEPWLDEALAALGGVLPVEIENLVSDPASSASADVQVLKPDLILADTPMFSFGANGALTEEFYSTLLEIGPTVLPTAAAIGTGGDYQSGVAWRESLLQAGQAFGILDVAQAKLDEIDASLAAAAAAHPEFAGKSIAVMSWWEGSPQISIDTGASAYLLTALGFIPVDTADIGPYGGFSEEPAVEVSSEYIATLDVDLLLVLSETDSAGQRTSEIAHNQPMASKVVHYLDSQDPVGRGFRSPTALSIPWALDAFVADLAGALE